MSPTVVASASPDVRSFLVLAPELILTVWGLVVLAVDFIWLRKAADDQRRARLGGLTLVGVLIALASTIPAILARVDPGTYSGLAGMDSQARPDATLFYGTIAADSLTAWMNLVVVGLLAMVVYLSTSWSFTDSWGEYFALLLWSTVGMMLLIAAEELLTLFLTLETMTICLYLLAAFERGRRRSAEAGLKYFVYGSVSSALFLYGLSLIYGLTGTTRFESIREALATAGGGPAGLQGNVAAAAAMLLMLVGFGFKIAAVPFHQWSPDVYEGAPAPVTAWIATGSKLASFIAMMKVLLVAVGPWASGPSGGIAGPGWIGLIAAISAATMTYGNFAALAQRNLKRMLAYSSIAHAGYMLVGVLAAAVSTSGKGAAGSVLFYLVIYSVSNVGAFAVAAWLARDRGDDDIDALNGLGRRHPGLATCIVLLMLSLIGMPPLAGFFAKIAMFAEALDDGNGTSGGGRLALTWLVALGLFNSVVSAFYYVRVLKAMFLRSADRSPIGPPPTSIALPIVLSAAVVVACGLYPSPVLETMRSAGLEMLSTGEPALFGTEPVPTPAAPAELEPTPPPPRPAPAAP